MAGDPELDRADLPGRPADRPGGAAEPDGDDPWAVGPGAIRFAGYAAQFDRLDGGGDIIRPGAFREALAKGRSIPVLWQHRPGAMVGRVEAIGEDERGLRVIGSVQARGLGEDVAELVRSKRVDGLSFGYRVRRARKLDGVRELLSLDLMEVSLVSRPMQPLARVHAVEG